MNPSYLSYRLQLRNHIVQNLIVLHAYFGMYRDPTVLNLHINFPADFIHARLVAVIDLEP